MEVPKIFESEYRFCCILWELESVRSGELAAACRERLGWKNSTAYTVMKRLAERGVLKNENSVITSLVSKDAVRAAEADEVVEKRFGGSLPAFVSAFARAKPMSGEELDELQRMIDEYRRGVRND